MFFFEYASFAVIAALFGLSHLMTIAFFKCSLIWRGCMGIQTLIYPTSLKGNCKSTRSVDGRIPAHHLSYDRDKDHALIVWEPERAINVRKLIDNLISQKCHEMTNVRIFVESGLFKIGLCFCSPLHQEGCPVARISEKFLEAC